MKQRTVINPGLMLGKFKKKSKIISGGQDQGEAQTKAYVPAK